MFGQTTGSGPLKPVRISGRITDGNRKPLAGTTLKYRNANRHDDLTVILDRDGRFAISLVSRNEYELYINDSTVPAKVKKIAGIVAVDGSDLDLGSIVVQSMPKFLTKLVGLVKTGIDNHQIDTFFGCFEGRSKKRQNPALIAAIFIGIGSGASTIHDGGRVYQPTKEKDQVDDASPRISDKRKAVGWVAEFSFSCASYPLAHALVV